MSAQKHLVRLFYDEMWNKADKSRIPEIFHPDFTFRGSLGPVLVGHAQFAGYVDAVVKSLPDFVCDIVEMIEEGRLLTARMRFHGHHRGELLGFAPTGAHVEWHGSAHFTFDEAMVRDLWVLGDVHGLSQQLRANASPYRE